MKTKTGKVIDLEVTGANTESENITETTAETATKVATEVMENIPSPADSETKNETTVVENGVNEDGEYNVSKLVKTGPRGVTNQGMIPTLKEYISKGETVKIKTLRKCFPEIVDSSLKYLGKKEVKKYKELIDV